MKKAFIITIDKSGFDPANRYKNFHDNLTTANGVMSWWHYLDNVYIIITNSAVTAQNVSEFVQQFLPNKQFLAAEIKLSTRQGMLPQTAWDWINKWASETEGNSAPNLFF